MKRGFYSNYTSPYVFCRNAFFTFTTLNPYLAPLPVIRFQLFKALIALNKRKQIAKILRRNYAQIPFCFPWIQSFSKFWKYLCIFEFALGFSKKCDLSYFAHFLLFQIFCSITWYCNKYLKFCNFFFRLFKYSPRAFQICLKCYGFVSD